MNEDPANEGLTVQKLMHLVQARTNDELEVQASQRLQGGLPVEDTPAIDVLAAQNGLPTGVLVRDLRNEEILLLGKLLDDRVAVMLGIWRYIGHPSPMPLSHPELIARIHEDSRFLAIGAAGSIGESVRAISQCIDPEADPNDLDNLFVDEQPSRFFYEQVLARLESCANAIPTSPENPEFSEMEEASDDGDGDADDSGPISANVQTIGVRHLYDLVEAGRIDLNPPWQRKDVWSQKKKRELIRSLLIGIPLPSIIFHKRGSKTSIIDGKQRLTAIVQFMRNEFRLPRYDVGESSPLYPCRDAWYNKPGKKSISDDLRTDFGLREIPALWFNDVPERRLRQIFRLYNVSGTQLNPAEIRNAVYQSNAIHRVVYVLADEATPTPDLETGDFDRQKEFTYNFVATLPSNARYAGVAFLSRYLGYSRAAQRDESRDFKPPSTSTTIDNYFDLRSENEDPVQVAREIVDVFEFCEEYFDIDHERLPFHRRDDKGNRRFNALVATTNLVASRFLLAAINSGEISVAEASVAIEEADIPYATDQQSSTIWDHQARMLIRLRETLAIDISSSLGDDWARFFGKMESALIPAVQA